MKKKKLSIMADFWLRQDGLEGDHFTLNWVETYWEFNYDSLKWFGQCIPQERR